MVAIARHVVGRADERQGDNDERTHEMVAVGEVSEDDLSHDELAVVLDSAHVSVRAWWLGLPVSSVVVAIQERGLM